jgi:hypothetical protein
MDDIFSKQPAINLTQFNNAYQQSFTEGNKYDSGNLDHLLKNNFNYDKVNNHVDTGKQKKDPFCFVDDMLKKK